MRVPMKRGVILTLLAAAQTTWLFPAPAGAEWEESRAAYTLHYFSDVDGVQVFSHYANAGASISRAIFDLQWGHDVVVFPAVDAPPGSQEAVDAITTASRPISGTTDPYEDFVKTRDEVTGTLSYKGARASYYVSTESDYYAQMVSFNYSQDLLSDNLNLSAGVSYGWDDIKPLEDDDSATGADFRNTLHANFIATQILTPITVVRLGGEFNRVEGLQHDPYRNVYVAGGNVPELHPRDRERWDVFLGLSQYINNRSSVKVDYRYYTDDWEVSSHTIGGKLSQRVGEEFVVRYRYRYYTQAPAYFFRADYTQPGGVSGFQTGDYRLGDFGAHLFGGQLLWFPYGALGHIDFLRGAHISFSYEHYFNSNNFSANIFETGLQLTF